MCCSVLLWLTAMSTPSWTASRSSWVGSAPPALCRDGDHSVTCFHPPPSSPLLHLSLLSLPSLLSSTSHSSLPPLPPLPPLLSLLPRQPGSRASPGCIAMEVTGHPSRQVTETWWELTCALTNWVSFIVSLCVVSAECLKLSLVKCNGGQKDDSHRPECILSNDINNTSASEPSLPHITQHDHIWYIRSW